MERESFFILISLDALLRMYCDDDDDDDDDVRQSSFVPTTAYSTSRVKRQTAERQEEEDDDGGRVYVFTLSLSLVSSASRVCDDNASSTHNTQKRSNNTHTLVRKQTAVLFFSFLLI